MGGRSFIAGARGVRYALGVAVLAACTGPADPASTPSRPASAADSSVPSVEPVSRAAPSVHRTGPDAAERARARLDEAGADLVSADAAWRALRADGRATPRDLDDALDRVRQSRAAMASAGADLDVRANARWSAPALADGSPGEPRAAR